MHALNATGEVFISHTKLRAALTLRLAVGNIRTDETYIRRTWRLLNEKLSELV
jgi:aromatic-L-amino-acid decarboxylase